ncbi:Methyltransferase domain-containing protein [Aquiflexum balticum DSM 16537]|uniref:site-specific DNA-methyltransferase (adenine-specific) n=1 Tax=Aquiflexum balticum DSM 16537 TaxID=758820 RepID=A0A1W2H8A3_9BACT|nr:N-6 DNA methylase [Aquiflexum balticum]SMD44858.1 Methyltransferase domain-containing protein [Aquiflexum balticum DSM 16537]
MSVLSSSQRSTLEKAVSKARESAQKGSDNALRSLAVDQTEPFGHMSPEQRNLRNRLRQKGRLLGDIQDQSGGQTIHKLSYELAYETWHKMLFAKFLEVNNLLMHPDGVAVTLMDCEELAAEEGHANKWETAMHYASLMLPAIFRPSDPVMQVHFASNDRIELEEIISALEDNTFQADDALGWVYQYWQSEEKDRINKSGDKIDGEKLPAVTQLFTEQYMVDFLIDNTLGAWWVSRNPGVEPPVKFEYLRYLEDGSPAAGKFEGWPDKTAEVTSLDPCMGSGHFVVSLFPIFAKLRMHEEGLSKEEATDSVIRENLHGLEIDPRCTQIAAFNLALTAWKFCGHFKELPEMNLACSGIAPKGKEEDWVKLVGKVNRDDQLRMENGMRQLYRHFQLAPELGSLLDPMTIEADAFTASFDLLQPVLERAFHSEFQGEQLERGVMAAGMAKAGLILSNKYKLIITNVPYLGFKKQGDLLKEFFEKEYADSKMDLSTVFIERSIKICSKNGLFATVSPQNWLFLGMYEKFRKEILKRKSISSLVFLGPGAFSQITGEVVKPVLISIFNQVMIENHKFIALDISESSIENKNELLRKSVFKKLNQNLQLINPNSRIVLNELSNVRLLDEYAISKRGVVSGDKDFWFRNFWELNRLEKNWLFLQSTVNQPSFYAGKTFVVNWSTKGMGMLRPGVDNQSYGKKGIVVNQMGTLSTSIYQGDLYDNNIGVIVPKVESDLLPIFAFCSSPEYNKEVRNIDKSLAVTNATLVKVPFDFEHWQKVAKEKYPDGLPLPYSDDSTQWLFHGHPQISENPILVAVSRILGYRWPAESDTEMELDPKARELIQEIQAFDHLSDEDGIFCIPSVNGEAAGADRLREYIQAVWGEQYEINTLNQLLEQEGATSKNLENWLRDEFFVQHCKVFNNRPFVWHIWDGRKDGFSALVNYHKLTKNNLSKLIYTYLGDWIRMCESKKKTGESGADGLLSAALKLKESLELILEGEKPYDIFVRWKPLSEQPIGWEPDLNDGVRLNIRPFIEAGILRKKPNIKWGKDRGKNPPGAPWGEERNNDLHLSLEEKRKARGI